MFPKAVDLRLDLAAMHAFSDTRVPTEVHKVSRSWIYRRDYSDCVSMCVWVCMCVSVCMSVCVFMFMCAYLCVCVCVCLYVCICDSEWVCVCFQDMYVSMCLWKDVAISLSTFKIHMSQNYICITFGIISKVAVYKNSMKNNCHCTLIY